jgi:hypothetical protein
MTEPISPSAAPESARPAVAETNGVQVAAHLRGWPDGAQPAVDAPARALLPVEVSIRNGSDQPLQIRNTSFTLDVANRSPAASLPIVPGDPMGPPLVIAAPAFVHSGFSVAPYLAKSYPSLAAYTGQFLYEAIFHEEHHDAAVVRSLPESTLNEALPEGVLAPGGELRGYLYFRQADLDVYGSDPALEVALSSVATKPAVARMSIPLATLPH